MAKKEPGNPAFRLTSASHGSIDLYAGKEVLLGRSLKAQARISHPTVSGEHATLQVVEDGNAILIKDLGSANGCLLNREKIVEGVAHEDDTLGFGRVIFLVTRLTPDLAEVAPPPAAATPSGDVSIMSSLTMARGLPPELLLDPRAAKLTLLLEVSKDLSRPVEVEELLERACDRMLKLTNVDRVAIVMVDEALKLATRIAATRRGRDASFAMPNTLAYSVIAEMKPMRVDRGENSAEVRQESLITRGIYSAMCAPLQDERGGLLGLLYVDSSMLGRSFSDEDLDLLQSFGGLVTSALRSSELVQALRREATALERLRARLGPNLGAEFFADGLKLRRGEVQPVVVVEARLVGLEQAARASEPGAATTALSEFFGAMAEVIFDYGGTLDRLQANRVVGDWGSTNVRDDNPDRAYAAARDMLRTWSGDKGSPRHQMAMGIGMASGDALVHSSPVDGRIWLTLVGEPVTTATQLAMRAGPGEILVASKLYESLAERPTASRVAFAKPAAYRVRRAHG